MSFRDFGGGGSDAGGHDWRQQPKQRRNEDESSFERGIRANIRELQECVRGADDQVEHARKGPSGRGRGRDSAEAMVERAQELARSTDQLFRDWTVHLAGEPFERQRKKLSFEKLRAAFDEEAALLKDVARRHEAVPADARSTHSRARGDATAPERDFEVAGLLDDSPVAGGPMPHRDEEERLRTQIVQEAALRSRIAQEREEGIRRIQGQVREVNHIFRDLASMVTDQGMQFETIEQQASSASMSTREAGEELKRAAERQKNARERLCWMVAGVALLLFLLVLPSLPRSLLTSSSPQEDVAVKATGMPRAPVVPERYKSVSVPGLADGQLGLLPEGSVVVHDTARLAR